MTAAIEYDDRMQAEFLKRVIIGYGSQLPFVRTKSILGIIIFESVPA
jgi:hypothetical protein